MKMIYIFLFFSSILFVCTSCSKDDDTAEEIEQASEALTFTYEQSIFMNTDLPYRKAIICPTQGEKPALVLYLHGGTSKGADNIAPINETGVSSISNYLMSNHINSVFIVPQCATNNSWGGMINTVLKALIDDYITKGIVDDKRIYIFGGSMGGTGIWSMLSEYPNLFAAAMPVAGNPSGCNAANVAKTPVLTVMGTDDQIMDIDKVSFFINQIANLGGNYRMEIENKWTHETTCTESYTAERLDWIFEYYKPNPL